MVLFCWQKHQIESTHPKFTHDISLNPSDQNRSLYDRLSFKFWQSLRFRKGNWTHITIIISPCCMKMRNDWSHCASLDFLSSGLTSRRNKRHHETDFNVFLLPFLLHSFLHHSSYVTLRFYFIFFYRYSTCASWYEGTDD